MIKQIGEHSVEIKDAPTGPIKIKSSLGGEWEIPLNELILNYDLPAEKAAWNRDELPEFFYKYIPDDTIIFASETVWDYGELVSLSDDDTKELIRLLDREMYRRRNGVHFRNGEEIVYLTGHHYFFLQWMKLYGLTPALIKKYAPWRPADYQYGEYLEFQADVFYLIEHVWSSEDILGLYIAKPKKTGLTQVFAGYYLNKGTMTRDAQMGVMSKGTTGAADVNMLFVLKGYDGLPPIFQPNIKERADAAGKIFFGESALRNVKTEKGKERRKKLLDARPLDTKIYAAKTKEAAFDSPVMQDLDFDEFCKYWSENKKEPETIFNRNLDAVKIQEVYNGRCWIMNYPPEEDDLGFHQGRKIYFDCKLSTIKPGEKRTKNGLICIHISAIFSYRSCFNRLGKCDEKRAHELNQQERDKVKGDKKAHQAKIRQYSETEKECWATAGAGSTFDNIRFGDLKDELDKAIRALEGEFMGGRFYEEGHFEWQNKLWEAGGQTQRPKKTFGKIEWVPLTHQQISKGDTDKVRIYSHIPTADICLALRMGRDKYGNLLSIPEIKNYGGIDPTDYAAETEVIEGSKNAGYALSLPNPILDGVYGRIMSNIMLAEWFDRPQSPDEAYEDVVKFILWHGMVVIVEANKKWMATRLIEDGLGVYMLVIDRKDGVVKRWSSKMYERNKDGNIVGTWGLISSSTDYKNAMVNVISNYHAEPKRDKDGELLNPDAKDYGPTNKSERLLQQIIDYSKESDKLFDLVRARGWAGICGQYLTQPPPARGQSDLYRPSLVRAFMDAFGK